MKGFKIVCNECGKEIDCETARKIYWISGSNEQKDIVLEVNHDGAIEEIKCECGNKFTF